jgi:two-component system response regulator DesR
MRILLADNRSAVRSALRLLLEQEAGVCIVGEVAEAVALLAQAEAAQPDLVLLDWELPSLLPRELLLVLRDRCRHTLVVAMSGRLEARRDALDAGVDAFVSKGESSEYLLAILYAFRGAGEQCDAPRQAVRQAQ